MIPTPGSLVNKMRRAIGILPFFLLLWSCSGAPESDPETIYFALAAGPSTLDPRFATDATGMRMSQLLFNSLVKVGSDLRLTGDAAESWEYHGTEATFRLRPHLTFSNGRAVLPEDILFSFEQYRLENNPFRTALDLIKRVDAKVDGPRLIVKISLHDYSAKLLVSDLPAVKILPKQELQKAGENFGQILLGTGSFVLENQTATEIIFRARTDHPFAPPKTKRVVFKIIRDDLTRFQKTYKGSIDIAQAELPLSKVIVFEKHPEKFQVFKYSGLSMTYLLVNLQDPLLKQLKVRQALARALQRQEIIKYKLESLATEATSILTPANRFFNLELKNLPYDVGLAQQLVAESGAKGATLILKTSNNPAAIDTGKVLANQLSKIGLKVELRSFEWGTFYDDVRTGNFQLATMRWLGALDPDIYRIALHSSEKPPGRNRGHYLNPELDLLLDAGLRLADDSRRIEHYKKVQKIVLDDLPLIPLWYDGQVAVVNRRVQDYTPPLNGDFSPLIRVYKK